MVRCGSRVMVCFVWAVKFRRGAQGIVRSWQVQPVVSRCSAVGKASLGLVTLRHAGAVKLLARIALVLASFFRTGLNRNIRSGFRISKQHILARLFRIDR
jgi:hypothetical protein